MISIWILDFYVFQILAVFMQMKKITFKTLREN